MKWMDILSPETKEAMLRLATKAQTARNNGCILYPAQNKIFRALDLTPPDKVKVVIIGQDPYHTEGVADGLAFSCALEHYIPPSLNNIYIELHEDLNYRKSTVGDLTNWAKRGVLLLNTSLTVYANQPNSHKNWGWDEVTKGVLQACAKLPQPVVFLLWGLYAQSLKDNIIQSQCIFKPKGIIIQPQISKYIIQSSHPSPFSVKRPCGDTPPFRGSRPFSKTNEFLGENFDWSVY